MRMTIIISLLVSGFSVHAVAPCPPRASLLGSYDVFGEPLKVNQVDDADRRTAKDYASDHKMSEDEVKARYAATGDLDCGAGKSQANVTLVGDVITTSAHSLVGDRKCVDLKKSPKCIFTLEIDGRKLTYETSKVVDSGKICGKTDLEKAGKDWAVLKLTKPVDGHIKPYRIDRDFRLRMNQGTAVTAVGKSFDWPDTKARDLFVHPKHYGDCVTKQPLAGAVQTNCDLSPGSSGGALVTPGADPVLVGVHWMEVHGGDGCPPPIQNKKTGPYSFCWANSSTLLTDSFADAVTSAAVESGYVPDDELPLPGISPTQKRPRR